MRGGMKHVPGKCKHLIKTLVVGCGCVVIFKKQRPAS